MNSKISLSLNNFEEYNREKTKTPVVFIPIGAMEWHDTHLPIGFDYLKAVELCNRIAEVSGGLVLPPLAFGYPFHLTKDPIKKEGTFCPDFDALENYTFSIGKLMVESGFKVIYFLSGHYERIQIYMLKSIGRRLEHYAIETSKSVKVLVHHEPDYTIRKGISMNAKEDYVRVELGLDYLNGDHAGFYETSLGLYLFPDLVKIERINPIYYDQARGGAPSAEWGKKWVDMIVEKASFEIQEALSGRDVSPNEPV
jgi:creatinine amidohydrolase